MADSAGQVLIRGLDVDKAIKGFALEANIFRSFVTGSKTSAREMRWYSKDGATLDSVTTTGITGSQIMGVGSRALPEVQEQEWTRNTSYVKKFMIESPTFSIEDMKDADVDVLGTNLRDLTRGLARKIDLRIYSVITEATAAAPTVPNPSNVNFAAATADGWNVTATADPIQDILLGKQKIRVAGYDPEGSILLMNPIEHRYLLQFLINVKGSSIPNWSSEKVGTGVVMNILGCRVVVSENATTNYVIQIVPNRAATWKTFMGLTTAVINNPGIGKKVRIWEEGECILTDPKAVNVITDVTN